MEGKTQETAAAKAGMSVRSARKWQSGPLPSQAKPEHRWRTRPDPFDGVWEDEIEPLLRNDPTGKLKATTIIDWLAEQHPGRFSASQLRTLQRRLQDWRALHGPDQEVYFPQVHPPGREAQFDFTHCGELKVTIAGQSYPHLLFQLILSHSGWRYAEVGETFLALAECPLDPGRRRGGAQRQYLGGHSRIAQQPRPRDAALLDHYGLRSTRNPGQSHENGVAEHAHYRLKDAIDQALILRGSRDFDTADDYASFVRQMVERRNRLVPGAGVALPGLPPAPVRIRQLPVQGAQVVHHPGSTLQRALPPHRQGGADPSVRRLGGSVLQGPPGGTDGTGAWRGGSQRQLPPRHWIAGAQAGSLRPLPLPGAAISHHALPADLRRAAAVAWGACRRGVHQSLPEP